jgi:hypothetical protein
MKNLFTIAILLLSISAFSQSKKNEIVLIYENVPTEVAFGDLYGKKTMRLIKKSQSFEQERYEGNINVAVWTFKNCKYTYSIFGVTNAGVGNQTLYTLIKHRN